eukprot:2822053-Prymnesium_polylepis.1
MNLSSRKASIAAMAKLSNGLCDGDTVTSRLPPCCMRRNATMAPAGNEAEAPVTASACVDPPSE